MSDLTNISTPDAETLACEIAEACADTALTNYHVKERNYAVAGFAETPSEAKLQADMLPYVVICLAPLLARLAEAEKRSDEFRLQYEQTYDLLNACKASLSQVQGERDAMAAENLDLKCFDEGQQETISDLLDAMKPFVTLVADSEGRIPTERLSFADWHKLSKVYRQFSDLNPASSTHRIRMLESLSDVTSSAFANSNHAAGCYFIDVSYASKIIDTLAALAASQGKGPTK